MKKFLQKVLLSALVTIGLTSLTFAQNWQYVGAPNINQTVGFTTYLYFPDLEVNSTGDFFVGYWKYTKELCFAKYSAGGWTQLPSPASFPTNNVDIEVRGSDYYMAYSGVKSGNMYVYVRKFNGATWDRLGDSLLLGNSGSGGDFDFLLDNNGVPTLLGVVSTAFGSKQAMQFTAGAWTSIHTFANSAATIFRENAGMFDSQNKLICVTQGFVTTPSLKYFTVINKLDAGVRTTVGDTINEQLAGPRIKTDANGSFYLACYEPLKTKVMAYKLNGSSWTFIADTANAKVGIMLAADVTDDGKVVFNTQNTNLRRSVFFYDNNTRYSMDSVNVLGAGIGAITDLVIPEGSSDVYILVLEITSSAGQDLSVMKHSVSGNSGINDLLMTDKSIDVYPNPSDGIFTQSVKNMKGSYSVKIYNAMGEIVYQNNSASNNQTINLSGHSKGIYLLRMYDGNKIYSKKIIVQ